MIRDIDEHINVMTVVRAIKEKNREVLKEL